MSELGFNVPPTMRSYRKGPQFKMSSERPEKWKIDCAIPGLVVSRVIHFTTAAPYRGGKLINLKSNLSLSLSDCPDMTEILLKRM